VAAPVTTTMHAQETATSDVAGDEPEAHDEHDD
jgi:hypothetical protein